ncbi:hypothetical protein [Actinotalea fermentans]|uniref:Uncharacterized protein n=1 Tax=Actinotalea fermentans TaxID=43671 RepID=A0A511YWA3_9CELL|nr:hypothetical protein [Actinotalea fermentans]KGM16422.1 hypothetical protein N867_20195 [Actinotalea fermentans ATCC 43279 = JCM 9966 = DSM 3133]GEN79449.1 hypothetical protein AFE02nite_11830 [Actinotalea fermentans]
MSSSRRDDARPVAHESEPTSAADAATRAAAADASTADASAAQDSADEPAEAPGEQASVDVMRLLSEHVPLTLLADLAQPTGPDSPDILEHEGLPDVAWWTPTAEEPQQH